MLSRNISSLVFRIQHRRFDRDYASTKPKLVVLERMDLTRPEVEDEKGRFGIGIGIGLVAVCIGAMEAEDCRCSLVGVVSYMKGVAAGLGKRWGDDQGNC